MKFTGERIVPNKNFCGESTKAYLEHSARYNFATKFVKNKKILDIACGTGYGSKILGDSGAKEVFGGDISHESINYATKNYSKKSIFFDIMDAKNLKFPDGYFDCIISFETIEHIPSYLEVLKEFKRVLKKDGMLIISTPNKDVSSKGRDKPLNPFHFKEFTIFEFTNLLENHFDNICLFSQLLIIKIGIQKKINRFILHTMAKLDFLKLHTKLLPEKTYSMLGDLADNTNQNFKPIPYDVDQIPVILIAICKNNS